MEPKPVAFQPEEITLLRNALDSAANAIPERYRTPAVKAHLAERILRRAASGERDLIRLKTAALLDLNLDTL